MKSVTEVEGALLKAKEIAAVQKKPVLVNVIIGKSDFRSGSLSM